MVIDTAKNNFPNAQHRVQEKNGEKKMGKVPPTTTMGMPPPRPGLGRENMATVPPRPGPGRECAPAPRCDPASRPHGAPRRGPVVGHLGAPRGGRAAAAAEARLVARLRELGDGLGGLCEYRAAGADARAAAFRKAYPDGPTS